MNLNDSHGSPSASPGLLAQVACLLEVTARKPGNVHPGCDFADSHFLAFLLTTAAIAAVYLPVLANHPDTLIARKRGRDVAHAASRRAADVLAAGWPDRAAGRSLCDEFETWLRGDGHARTPGATADLITAALFAALREGTIPLPRPAGSSGW